jgi:hypothetical protein
MELEAVECNNPKMQLKLLQGDIEQCLTLINSVEVGLLQCFSFLLNDSIQSRENDSRVYSQKGYVANTKK